MRFIFDLTFDLLMLEDFTAKKVLASKQDVHGDADAGIRELAGELVQDGIVDGGNISGITY